MSVFPSNIASRQDPLNQSILNELERIREIALENYSNTERILNQLQVKYNIAQQ